MSELTSTILVPSSVETPSPRKPLSTHRPEVYREHLSLPTSALEFSLASEASIQRGQL